MPEAKQVEPVLVLHNTVRRQHTRLKRAQSPTRHRFKQYVGGAIRVTRNRPRPVRQSFVEKHLVQLKDMFEAGLMEVRTRGGQLVDLNTMKAASPPKPKPQPNRRLDSAADDKPMGSPKPMYEEGKGLTEPVEAPSLARGDIPEGHDPEPPEPAPSGSGPRKRGKKRGKK